MQSGPISTRPARSSSAPDAFASFVASGDACTPAAQSTVCVGSTSVRSPTPDRHLFGTDVRHHGPGPHGDAQLRQRAFRPGGQFGRISGQDAVGRLQQIDRGVGRVDAAEVAAQRGVGRLGHGAGQLDAGRPAAHDDERQQRALPGRVGVSARPPRRPSRTRRRMVVASSMVFRPGRS